MSWSSCDRSSGKASQAFFMKLAARLLNALSLDRFDDHVEDIGRLAELAEIHLLEQASSALRSCRPAEMRSEPGRSSA